MPANKDFAQRIEIIDDCLRNNLKKWTLGVLLKKVNSVLLDRYNKEIKKRTLQADIKYLIDEKGAPITKTKIGKETIFSYLDVNFSIKNIPIQNEEVELLGDAINILKQVNDFKILKEIQEVVSKLRNTIDTNSESDCPIIHFENHTVAKGTEFIDDLYNAIKLKTCLRITYKSFTSKDEKVFIFHPYILKEFRNRWFVLGRKDSLKTGVILALDRIQEIKNSISDYLENDIYDIEKHFYNLIGVSIPEGETAQKIEIKVHAKQAPYIITKPIHNSQKVKRKFKNGNLLVELLLINNYELKSMLLSYGDSIEVVSPDTLRNEMIIMLKKTIKNYET